MDQAPGPRLVWLKQALEPAVGCLLAGLVAWGGHAGWRFYDVHVLPYARAVPLPTPTPVDDPVAAKREARRLRRVLDHLGAGYSFLQADRPDLAIQEFQKVLALDPGNHDARENLAALGVAVPETGPEHTPVAPTATALPTVTPPSG